MKVFTRKNVKVAPSTMGTIQHHHNDAKDGITEDISESTVAPLEVAWRAKQTARYISKLNGEHYKPNKLEDNSQINWISSEIRERLVTEQVLQKGESSDSCLQAFGNHKTWLIEMDL